MAIDIPKQEYTGSVKPMTLGTGDQAFTIGGDTAFPFFTFEGQMPNAPRLGIQVLDYAPDDWAEACLAPYKDVIADPVEWALKAQNDYGADFIQLWLKSTDPNGLNRSAEEAAQTAKAVAEAISVPLLVWGTANVDKDAEVLSQVAQLCSGTDLIIGPVSEENHKQIGAQALAYGLTIVANSPIDINLAKQLNILLNNLGVPLDKIIIDPTTGGLGYGLEYTFSVMERIRHAALTQNDDKLQCPFIANLADEVWKCKEAKLPTDETMGDAAKRGILMESITATTLLNAGASLLVMRHPEALQLVREYIADLGGFEKPAALKKAAARAAGAAVQDTAASQIAASLEEGALCRIVRCMDTPPELGPGYAIALIKVIDSQEAQEAGGIVLTTQAAAAAASAEAAQETAAGQAVHAEPAEFKPATSWTPIDDPAAGYKYALQEQEDFSGKKVKLIQSNYEEGLARGKEDWRSEIEGKENMIQQVKTSLHYWYGEAYGSERRKKPA